MLESVRKIFAKILGLQPGQQVSGTTFILMVVIGLCIIFAIIALVVS